jgi:hypothetical protein
VDGSNREDELFAAIVSRVGDPEWRRHRLILSVAGTAVLALCGDV